MDASTAKVISMIVLGLGSFVVGMIPVCISRSARQRYPLLSSCLLCFGAGVLLSTSLLHMLPEAREKLPDYSELVLCVGFFLIYAIDEIVHFFVGVNENGVQLHEGPQQRSYGAVDQVDHGETSFLVRDNDGEMIDTGNVSPRLCHLNHQEPCNKTSSGVIGLLSALSVHSLLEGLAIGLQETASQVLLLLGAVASHKYVVGFCLGAELCENATNSLCKHIIYVGLFSGGSVAGIGLGAALETASSLKDSIAVPIMQALAAGTLLYVTVSEVLPRERARWHERKRGAGIVQFITVAIGFVLMYLSTRYLDHDDV